MERSPMQVDEPAPGMTSPAGVLGDVDPDADERTAAITFLIAEVGDITQKIYGRT